MPGLFNVMKYIWQDEPPFALEKNTWNRNADCLFFFIRMNAKSGTGSKINFFLVVVHKYTYWEDYFQSDFKFKNFV